MGYCPLPQTRHVSCVYQYGRKTPSNAVSSLLMGSLFPHMYSPWALERSLLLRAEPLDVHIHRCVLAFETPFQVNRSWQVRCLNNLSWSSLASPLDSCEPGSSGWGRGDWKPLLAAPECWMHPPRPGGNMWCSLSSPFSLASSLMILSSGCPLESPGKLKKKFLYLVPTPNQLELELASNDN